MKRKINLQFFAEEASVPFSAEENGGEKDFEPAESISIEEPAEITEPTEPTEPTDLIESANETATISQNSENDSVLSDEVIRKIYGHLARLEEETKELKETFPDFDLYRELRNPVFARLTAPESGISAVDAYYAIHRKEIQSLKNVGKDSISKRPSENGISAQAPIIMEFDYRNATKERREALKKAIRSAAARGEKIYPH